MNFRQIAKNILDKIVKDIRIFPAQEEIEITGNFLDMEIRGTDRTDIKIEVQNRIHRKSAFNSIESYYSLSFAHKEGKLIIGSKFKGRNSLIDDIWPTERCKLVIELPKCMAASITGKGAAHMKITDVQGNLKLNVTATAINLFGTRNVEATIKDQSWMIISGSKAQNYSLRISASSTVNILNDAEIGKIDATIEGDGSLLESVGKIGNASIFVEGGCKLKIQKIKNSPMIISMDNKKNDIQIVEIGVE